jgi:diaminohydroxyphosphoribosylaminopyrimidine deaminase / 5-amino-6-(5-phosphoribosylamino)uracil reductase
MGESARRGAGRRDEAHWMRLALSLAALGRGRTHPNPRVGAVAVRGGRAIGVGAHLRCGGPHAEAVLLGGAAAGGFAGATVFVNLEPCAHHGRTPPCAPSLARAGVARVVAAIEDPDPRVRGRGFDGLRGAGIEVEIGRGARAARLANAPFLRWQARRLPWVTLKLALSLDGRIAAPDGASRWISGPEARERVHAWRAGCDAIVIGRGTWTADRPRLTARPARDPLARLRARVAGSGGGWPPQPARVVLDSRARTAGSDELLARVASADGGGPWIFACGRLAPAGHLKRLEAAGARCWVLPAPGGSDGVDACALLERLAQEGRLDVLVEGGATLATELLRAGAIQRLRLFLAPTLLGGERVGVGDLGIESIAGAIGWRDLRARRIGRDLLVSAFSPEAEALLADGVSRVGETRCSRV